jgi:hypothetical protein
MKPANRPKRQTRKAPAGKKDEEAYEPKQKLFLKLSLKNRENAPTDDNEVRSTRGRAVRRTSAYQEAMDSLMGGDGDEFEDTGPAARKQSVNKRVKAQQEGNGVQLPSGEQQEDGSGSDEHPFLKTVDPDIVNIYDSMVKDPEISMELITLTKPSPDPTEKDDREYDVTVPWTAQQLFHLYILAYIRFQPTICDLIVDTWIRRFQAMDDKYESRIWLPNRSEYLKQRLKTAPKPDNGYPEIARGAMRFDLQRLTELYENTDEDCGARLVWADAMALCGRRLEPTMRKFESGMDEWPAQLVKDVCQTSLRSMRVRLTLKLEEPDPKEWCQRYHMHTRYDLPCYRALYKEQEAAKKAAEISSDEDAPYHDAMDIDAGNTGKHVSFAQ